MLMDTFKDKLLQIGPSSGLILSLLHAIVSLQFFISYFSSFILWGSWEYRVSHCVCVAFKSKENLKESVLSFHHLGQASGSWA